jgi:hypothetical protein
MSLLWPCAAESVDQFGWKFQSKSETIVLLAMSKVLLETFEIFCVNGIPTAILFSWHVRCRIRYSCSTLATAFARFIAPKLKKMGLGKDFFHKSRSNDQHE